MIMPTKTQPTSLRNWSMRCVSAPSLNQNMQLKFETPKSKHPVGISGIAPIRFECLRCNIDSLEDFA